MPEISHTITREGVAALRQQVEDYLKRRIVTPADYIFLSVTLREQVKMSVSNTTLKRVWGYVRDMGVEYKPSRYTVCALARMLGYQDYEDFIDAYNRGETQSRTYSGAMILSNALDIGDMVEVSWSPARMVSLRFLGNNTFAVIESVNAKIHAGDTVECCSFTQNAPLFINRVLRGNEPPVSYVAGSRTGIRFRIITPLDS